MVPTWRLALVLGLGVVVGCSHRGDETAAVDAEPLDPTTVLTCSKLTIATGKTGGQPVSALATKDLSGTTDAWSKYVELQPSSSGFVGTCTFPLPSGTTSSSIGSLALRVNYRGPEKSFQTWTFDTVDASGQKVVIGDNAFAQDWVWTEATLPIAATPSALVQNGQIQVTIRTATRADVADIDELVLVASTSTTSTTTTDAGTSTTGWWKPTNAAPIHWAWQLSDTFQVPRDVRSNVTVYDLDGELTSAATVAALHALGPDVKVICYFDAGVWESYRSDASSFPKSIIGNPDEGWANSYWMDVRQLDVLMPLLKNRMVAWCKDKGFDAIEPDETEVWSNNPGFPITLAQNTAFNQAVAAAAHELGLSVGLKGNNTEAGLLEPYFDWALTEQCWQYSECDDFQTSFLAKGKAVFDVEYQVSPNCAQSNAWHMNAVKRDLDLVAPSSPGYLYQPCVPDTQSTW